MTNVKKIVSLTTAALCFFHPVISHACGVSISWGATLNGAKTVPSVKSSASASAVLHWVYTYPEATLTITTKNLHDVSGADLHFGPLGKNGPTLFTLYSPSNGLWTNQLTAKITPAQLQAHPEVGIKNYNDAVTAIAQGNVYMTIVTKAHPLGELRGQILLHKQVYYTASETGYGHDPKLHQIALRTPH